jgi:spermidine/putrescine transport system permease protein
LPLIFPGILAAALLAFALSIDDFVISQFTAGQTITFPLWVYGASRIGVPPQVNVMGTLIFLIALVGIVLWVMLQRRDAAMLRRPAG